MSSASTLPRLRLLGAVGLECGDRVDELPVERALQLLVVLACAGDWVERDRLAHLFWPDHEPDAARRNVRKQLHRLRQWRWGSGLQASATRVRWAGDSDLAAFDAAVAAQDAALALRLYRGELAPRFEVGAAPGFAQWLLAERERRARSHQALVLRQIAATPAADQRLALAQPLNERDPLDEELALACAQAWLDLGRHADAAAVLHAHARCLGSELAIAPSARVLALLRAAAQPAGAAGGQATAAAAVAPPESGHLVGRRAELRALLDALAHERVVTLHGPGGIGKSRLARAAVERLAADPAWRWPPLTLALAELADATAVAQRLAAALGVALGDAPDPWTALQAHLHSRPLLLVLDNAEQVAGLQAALARLLGTCSELRLLVTSRQPVALPGECVTSLAGLPWPDDEDATEPDIAARFDAVALFRARALAVDPGFDLARQLEGVVSVARLVQGLPLALELAAGWSRLLPAAEIAAELEASIDVLERAATAPPAARPEHASLRATLQRSWDLLVPSERAALTALGTMRGGFGHDAARAVAGAAMPVLAALVDKSLVQSDPARARLDLHPLVAAFAREQAARQPAEAAAVAARHAAWFADWLRRTAPQATTAAAAFNAAVAAELGNLELAWDHAVRSGDAAMLAQMANPLSNYFENSGRFREGMAWLERAVPVAAAQRPLALQLHRGLGTLAYRLGAHERVERHAREAVRLARQLGEGTALKAALNLCGLTLWQRNRFAEATRYFEAALRKAEQDGDHRGIAVFTSNLGLVARELGDFDRSLSLLQRAHAAALERGHHRSAAIGCNNIGNHHRLFAAWDDALRWLHEGLAIVEQHGLQGLRASFAVNLGLAELGRGALDPAQAWLERALALDGRGAEPYLVVAARLGQAQLLIRREQFAQARSALAAAVQQSRAVRAGFHALEAVVVLAEWHAARGARDRAAMLLQRLLAEPGLDATLRVEATRALAGLGPVEAAAATTERPVSLQAVLDDLVAQAAFANGGTPVEHPAA
ncbi:MAG: tetratricopeptide repeat protein [Rubrivivax sp.]|nr:tetratricopeptide repeat protein [Rubrivivax sp.]